MSHSESETSTDSDEYTRLKWEVPYEITPLKEEEEKRVKEKFLGFKEGLVRVGDVHMMPTRYKLFAHTYYNYVFSPNDVVIMSHPCCGSTWVEEMVWLCRNEADFDTATRIPLSERVSFFEWDSLVSSDSTPPEEFVKHYRKRHYIWDTKDKPVYLDMIKPKPKDRRIIKTHLPFHLLDSELLDTCKVFYIIRNPKDVCVSYYHQQRLLKSAEFIGTFEEYVDFWCQDLLLHSPYWQHLKEAWRICLHHNLMFFYYEDMQVNPLNPIHHINGWLKCGMSPEQKMKVAEFCSFKNMKSREATNPMTEMKKLGKFKEGEEDFMRKGETGNWKSYFTPELEAKFDKWMERWEDIAKQFDNKLKYEVELPDEKEKYIIESIPQSESMFQFV